MNLTGGVLEEEKTFPIHHGDELVTQDKCCQEPLVDIQTVYPVCS